MLVSIWCKTSFIGFHRWLNAPEHVRYLRDYHRHVFHVKLWKEVKQLDREIEFHTLKLELNKYLDKVFEGQFFSLSCEEIANDLLKKLDAKMVDVSEDNECGSTIYAGD